MSDKNAPPNPFLYPLGQNDPYWQEAMTRWSRTLYQPAMKGMGQSQSMTDIDWRARAEAAEVCTHSLAEAEAACYTEGLCPICLLQSLAAAGEDSARLEWMIKCDASLHRHFGDKWEVWWFDPKSHVKLCSGMNLNPRAAIDEAMRGKEK